MIKIRNYASIYDSACMTVGRTVHDSIDHPLGTQLVTSITCETEDFLWSAIKVAVESSVSDITAGTITKIIDDERKSVP